MQLAHNQSLRELKRFHISTEEEIKKAATTDIYFERTKEILEKEGLSDLASVSNAPTIDFALDIVEAGGRPVAKRGKLGGRKLVWRCDNCLADQVTLAAARIPKCYNCGKETYSLLRPLVENGHVKGDLPKPDAIREGVLRQLGKVPTS